MPVDPAICLKWLQQFTGTWTMSGQCVMGPDQPPILSTGRESVRAFGENWILFEGSGEMAGAGAMESVMTVGYDAARGKFVGTWVGSCMTTVFVYEGELEGVEQQGDRIGGTVALNTKGPSFTDPAKIVDYQDVLVLHTDGRRFLHSQVLGDDGKWTRFMTAEYKRA